MVTLYGIPNCDTVKKARAWLVAHRVEYRFHDFRTQGVPAGRLAHWLREFGAPALLNRGGTTWRRLDERARASADEAAGAQALMSAHPALIRRPVVEWSSSGADASIGFSADDWSATICRIRAEAPDF